MTRLHILEKVKQRKEDIGLSIDSLSKLSQLGNRTVTRFLSGEDVKLSTLEKVTNSLGLDFSGNEVIDLNTLIDKRASEKALYIISLVQDTSALEMQGLENDDINTLFEETKKQFLYGDYRKNLWAS